MIEKRCRSGLHLPDYRLNNVVCHIGRSIDNYRNIISLCSESVIGINMKYRTLIKVALTKFDSCTFIVLVYTLL